MEKGKNYSKIHNRLALKNTSSELLNELTKNLSEKKAKDLLDFIENREQFKEIEFTLYEEVKAAARPRKSTLPNGFIHFYDPTSGNKKKLKKIIKEILPDDWVMINGEVELEIISYRSIVKSFNMLDKILAIFNYINPLTKPDVDNIAKQLMDVMNKFVYKDDSQITDLHIVKKYSDNPRTIVNIRYRENPITTKISKK